MPYLDHSATTPIAPEVIEAMNEAMGKLSRSEVANPSSIQTSGRAARSMVNDARRQMADLFGASPEEMIFTSSASEANNLAIKGCAFKSHPNPFHLIISAFEHDSVLNSARYLANQFDWINLSEIPPDSNGIVEPNAIHAALELTSGHRLVCVMTANNETGTIQPVLEIANLAHEKRALFLTDAVQAIGRIPVNVREMGCDFLTASAHKIYGPHGMGLLYLKSNLKIDPLIHGGHQESGRRAGTENIGGIVGFSRAMQLVHEHLAEDQIKLRSLESAFLARLRGNGAQFILNGSQTHRVPGILNLSAPGIMSDDLVIGMDLAGFAISAGAACSSGVIEASHVLTAMSLEPWRIQGGVRISMGRGNTLEEVIAAADAMSELCKKLKQDAPIPRGQTG